MTGVLAWAVSFAACLLTVLSHGCGVRRQPRNEIVEVGASFEVPYLQAPNDPAPGTPREFVFPRQGYDGLYLFVYFAYEDCYEHLVDAGFWASLRREFRDSLLVVGVTSDSYPTRMQYLLREKGITIPVINDKNGILWRLLTRVNAGLTPAMLLTSATGHVLDIDPNLHTSPEAQHDYTTTVATFLRRRH